MKKLKNNELKPFVELLNKYNQCFYDRDIDKLKKLYIEDNVIYFDNHKGADSYHLNDHLEKVYNFFKTETIFNLSYEDLIVFKNDKSACMTAKLRYSIKPYPGIRSTFYLVKKKSNWKIMHIHCSFDPNEYNTL